MRYAYYPGCSLVASEKEYNISTKAVLEALGIEAPDIEDWNCCGATAGHAINHNLSLALPARNLALAEDSDAQTIIAPCSECFHNLAGVNNTLKGDEREMRKVNTILADAGLEYRGGVEVRHVLDVVAHEVGYDYLREHTVRDLSKLRIAPYYGCLVVRPPDVANFDRLENPQTMDNIAKAVGAQVVDYADYKTACCGGALILPKEDVALKLIKNILLGAKRAGANCIIVPCPMCHMNLDAKQALVEETFGVSIDIPVLYFPQLLGLAMGLDPGKLGLEKNIVSPKRILDLLGIEFAEELSVPGVSITLEEEGQKKRLVFELG
ncbi:MAG: heterodisulfide reductase subunit B [Methanobacteriota archaeon]|nr:MAG: heterodisulfide reductase subunit B [Euryarchaeota archaeon]